jgi:hypothetical protein
MTRRAPRIVTLSAPWPSVVRAFREGQAEGLWSHVTLDPEKRWSIPEADLYLVADGYRPYYEPIIDALKDRFGAKVGFYFNSPLLQSDMSKQEISLACTSMDMLEAGRVDFIVFLSRSWWRIFDHPRLYHLPHAVHLSAGARPPNPAPRKDRTTHVGLFIPTTHRKNIAHQIAALQGRDDVFLHTNVEFPYHQLLQRLKIPHKVHPWLSPARHRRVVAGLDLALQVTHREVESFCYGALDPMLHGIPTLVSRTIADNFGLDVPGLVVEDPSDLDEVRARTHALLDLTNAARRALGRRCLRRVQVMARENTRGIRAGLRRIWTDINEKAARVD